jgi:hypothetical protein
MGRMSIHVYVISFFTAPPHLSPDSNMLSDKLVQIPHHPPHFFPADMASYPTHRDG